MRLRDRCRAGNLRTSLKESSVNSVARVATGPPPSFPLSPPSKSASLSWSAGSSRLFRYPLSGKLATTRGTGCWMTGYGPWGARSSDDRDSEAVNQFSRDECEKTDLGLYGNGERFRIGYEGILLSNRRKLRNNPLRLGSVSTVAFSSWIDGRCSSTWTALGEIPSVLTIFFKAQNGWKGGNKASLW